MFKNARFQKKKKYTSAPRVMENNPLSCVKKTAHRVRTVRFPNDAQWNWASKIAAVEKKIYI